LERGFADANWKGYDIDGRLDITSLFRQWANTTNWAMKWGSSVSIVSEYTLDG
jgi:hypothetical protein